MNWTRMLTTISAGIGIQGLEDQDFVNCLVWKPEPSLRVVVMDHEVLCHVIWVDNVRLNKVVGVCARGVADGEGPVRDWCAQGLPHPAPSQ